MNPVTSGSIAGRWKGAPEDDLEVVHPELADARQERDDALALLEQRRLERRALDRELVELRATLQEAERQLANVRQTFIYRIGEALVSARSLRGVLRLPHRLLQLRRAFVEKRRAEGGSVGETQIAARLRYVDEAMRILARDGVEAARDHLSRLPAAHAAERARAMVEIAQAIRRDSQKEAGELALDAARLNPREMRLRNLALNLFEDGAVRLPAAIIELVEEQFHQPADRRRREAVQAFLQELDVPFRAPAAGDASLVREGKAVLGISSRSAPHDGHPASWRLHSVLDAAAKTGRPAIWLTEPGFRHPVGHEGAFHEQEEGVQLRRLPSAIAHPTALRAFREEVADLIEAELLTANVDVIHADVGDPLFAAAALVAARRTGVRFVADVGDLPFGRGGVTISERDQVLRNLFLETVRGADGVIVRSETLKDCTARLTGRDDLHLVRHLIPSALRVADTDRVAQLRRELELEGRRVIGVLSLLNGDEGLADLVHALVEVVKVEPQAVLLFAGDGMGAQTLRLLAAGLGVGQQVIFLSGASCHGPADILAMSDVVAFPQREFDAEAAFLIPLAMMSDRPVVAADGTWTREILRHGTTALLPSSGDTSALADALVQVLGDRLHNARMIAAARKAASVQSDPDLFATRLMLLLNPEK